MHTKLSVGGGMDMLRLIWIVSEGQAGCIAGAVQCWRQCMSEPTHLHQG
jgi:hypothetical protein